MPLYLVQAERISIRQIEIEADGPQEAHAKVSSMSEYRLESEAEDDYHWTFGWDPVRVNEDLQPIDEPTPEPESTRLGGDEILHNLMAGDGHNLRPEFCQ
jgi:hypothetical protein